MPPKGGPILPAGVPMEPIEVVRAMRWMGDLKADEIVTAIRFCADADPAALAERFPGIGPHEIEAIRTQAAAMTNSRLRAWMEKRPRQPTWAEVRALIYGLRQTMD